MGVWFKIDEIVYPQSKYTYTHACTHAHPLWTCRFNVSKSMCKRQSLSFCRLLFTRFRNTPAKGLDPEDCATLKLSPAINLCKQFGQRCVGRLYREMIKFRKRPMQKRKTSFRPATTTLLNLRHSKCAFSSRCVRVRACARACVCEPARFD